MALIVQKYGGSSVKDPESLKRVARRIVEEHRRGNQLVVVVSAMGETTDHLVELAHQVSSRPPEREMDMLLSVGERISIALLAMAIHELGDEAISFTGSQVGIITDNHHTEARILEVKGLRIREALNNGKIVIVAGFQGVSINKEITTLGRGGSDTTAIALAAALQADRCEIMKDVDGVFVSEPRLVPDTRLNHEITYDEMIEMANLGAGVLKPESVETARRYNVKVAVGSSFTGEIGTIITDKKHDSAAISGIVGQKDMIYLKLHSTDFSFKNKLNQFLASGKIKVQSYIMQPNSLELVFQERHRKAVKNFLDQSPSNFTLEEEKKVGIIGIIGTGLNFNSRAAFQVFRALENLHITPEMLQVSEFRISWILPEGHLEESISRLHHELIRTQPTDARKVNNFNPIK